MSQNNASNNSSQSARKWGTELVAQLGLAPYEGKDLADQYAGSPEKHNEYASTFYFKPNRMLDRLKENPFSKLGVFIHVISS